MAMKTILNSPDANIAVIVAHPDDETLWCGGLMLMHPQCNWYVISLCRKSDPDRAPKFFRCLKMLKADGTMADLDDGPGQIPLKEEIIEKTILQLLGSRHFDLVITHDPSGEYTRHRRHEEIGKSVINLWKRNELKARELWTFAYEDGDKTYFSKAIENASILQPLSEEIWKKKYKIITETYGFKKGGFEAETTPKTEAFWTFKKPFEAVNWLKRSQTKYPDN